MDRALLILLVAISFSVSGELLLKHGMNTVGMFSLQPGLIISGLVRTFTNLFVLGGFSLIFLGSVFWLSVLSRLPLSLAYPLLSLSYVLVVLSAWLILKESISVTRVVGVFIIMSGVVVVFRS
ncbi:MAG: EamA family transporter [Dehalococcoidia bacterium]|nr:EamA family transporter [Dehalococcoidia bacterium]